MIRFRIVNTDNFNGDYPCESFVENLPILLNKEHAKKIADAINAGLPQDFARYWKVVEEGYVLQGGFEP